MNFCAAVGEAGSIVGCVKDVGQALAGFITVGAGCAALYWFLFTRSFRHRIQFDIDLQILELGDPEFLVAEAMLIIENKGQREHRLYNLFCEARSSKMTSGAETPTYYMPTENIVPASMEYFFVAAGVRQILTRAFKIPKAEKVIRVSALFGYGQQREQIDKLDSAAIEKLDTTGHTTHFITRLFPVQPRTFTLR